MVVTEGPGGRGTRIIATRYPVEEGLEAGTQKQEGREIALVPDVSNVSRIDKEGINQ